VASCQAFIARHNAEEVAQRIMPTALKGISEEDMWALLGKEEDMKEKFPQLPTMATTVNQLKQSDKYKRYTVFLNSLSEIVRKQLGWSTNAAVINKLTSPIRTLRSYPFLRPP
jgi:hypothetical protein